MKSSDRELSLADFISVCFCFCSMTCTYHTLMWSEQVKLYEKTQEWKEELGCLKLRNAYKDEELHSLKISCDKLQDVSFIYAISQEHLK